MDKQQHIHELIDQYLNGELMGQELDKFKIRLKEDPAFLQQVQVQKAIISSIEAHRQAELKAMLVASKAKKRGLIIPFGNRSLAVAASILSLLAFGLIIKTMLPNGIGELTQKDEPVKTKEVMVDSNQEVDDSDQEIADSKPVDVADSANVQQPPEIAIVEDTDDQTEGPNDVLFESDDDMDLSELKKDEDEIDGTDFKTKRDSLLGSKSVTLLVMSFETAESRVETTSKTTEVKKEGLFNKKSKDKEEDDKALSGNDAEKAELIKAPGGSIKVEFWESIVKFKGYKYDGKTLLLFDTPVSASIALQSYEGVTYLNKNGVFYKLIPNSSFNQMSRVTNADLLKILNTK